MRILAHRGLWDRVEERNTRAALCQAWTLGYGIETDIRDRDGALVVAHDLPSPDCPALDDVLSPDQVPPGTPIALNLKADGLCDLVKAWIARARHLDAFVFDMSVPEQLKYRNAPCFTRQSEFEPSPVLYESARGVWLDAFQSDWWPNSLVERHLAAGKQVALVSPELHGRDHQVRWRSIRDSTWWRSSDVLLCTDFPHAAAAAFHG